MDSPSLSFRKLLRLAYSEPAYWLAGDAQADPPVEWISASLEQTQAGDVLLLPAEALTSETLQRARQAGVAAVLVVGEDFKGVEPLAIDLPAAVVSGQGDLRSIQRNLQTILINQRAALMERGVRIHTQLAQLAAQGEGLEGLVRVMADISGRGVVVQDKRLGVLAHQPSSTLAGIWEDVLGLIQARELLPEALRDRKLAGGQNQIVFQEMPGGLARLLVAINVAEVARGYLSLVGAAGELDALDQLVIEQGVLVCAIEMARVKAVREAEKRLKGDLLTALLQEDLASRDAQLWVTQMGLNLSEAHVALRFSWDAPLAPSRRRLETLVNGEVTNRGLKVIVSLMGSEVICFCQVGRSPARPEAALAFGQAVCEQGALEYPEIPIRCGIGAPAEDLVEWRSSFHQAGQALELARRIGQRAPLFFPDLSVYRLLLQMEHSPELGAFLEETLGPLLAQEGSAELLRTLESYFEHNGNLSQTAEDLYIHRNTLAYRLERIAQVTKLNLDAPETRLAVQLALHIHRMTGSK